MTSELYQTEEIAKLIVIVALVIAAALVVFFVGAVLVAVGLYVILWLLTWWGVHFSWVTL
jgi:hypothetical protein